MIGVWDEKLSELLQMNDSFKLAVIRVQQAETVQIHQEVVSGSSEKIYFLMKTQNTSDVLTKKYRQRKLLIQWRNVWNIVSLPITWLLIARKFLEIVL